ncbi:GAF domain-containing protein [Methylobacterium sp. E-025]|uniref:GAF domain-containing protein n=1 Tax=Methylobacterium sp. E-025 TaxID=2836561 RepID=UPI001FBA0B16|nr:GAF domain-containing protein [Methylobacterium sp. E-025]MCJ2113241.1 GAF domain-containing protein [Methylobacterium sp. E-025]
MLEGQFQTDRTLGQARDRLALTQSLEEVVSVLRETARTVMGSDGIAVILREGKSCHYVAENAIDPLWRGQRLPMAACISGWTMLNDETAIVPDIDIDPRLPAAAYRATSMRSLVMNPIGSPKPIAALGAYWCTAVFPNMETVTRLETLAHHATAAIARVQTMPGTVDALSKA